VERCETCGRLNPQLAVGLSSSRSLSARMRTDEGYSPGNRAFRYKRDPRCMVCRHGTKSKLSQQSSGRQLKAWLVAVNERR
jgi:hypothetical protein